MLRLRIALENWPSASNRTFEFDFAEIELDAEQTSHRVPRRLTKEVIPFAAMCKRSLAQFAEGKWGSGELPNAWQMALLVPIAKKGKCTTAAESCRPIMFSSVISKIMGRMLYNLTGLNEHFGHTESR
ncbi:RNA-directed DNA polymerase from mobile element jockey [Plakobranchus ocellatus]|uniref:RNA-directed DNA polymerase from mobile element jockey n=1 Tax=Plakobranchus ocellatus TaxID=259542 RepID=A0AAV4BBU2_9GAST|nr:RNA-directed DNA polymerase from mobile element jockey [Plakobranchus ocellatus]